jgi:hypothetical protein
MTSFLRAVILIIAGIGVTIAAIRIGGGPPSIRDALDGDESAQDQTTPAPAEAPSPAPDASASSEPPTESEVEAELRRAEEAIAGKAKASEELPVKPLRADLPISLPSDI